MVHRMLLALDGSDASEKEVDYVAEMVSRRDEVHFHLVHVLPPPTLAESRGAHEAARAVLDRLQKRLVQSGVAPERIDIGTIQGGVETSIVDALLDLVRDQECDTIVVGRNSLPWHRELLHHHPADEIVRRASGVAVWVVE